MSEPEKIYEFGSAIPILVYGTSTTGKTTFAGQRPQGVILDELPEVTHSDHTPARAVDVNAPPPEPAPMPPHASYPSLNIKARTGDEIVIIGGDQKGWRGRILSVEGATIRATMTKLDGSKANNGMPVVHKAAFVAKVLVTPPPFISAEDADAWLTAMDREIRPEYLPGEMVQFERQVRVKKRGKKPVQKRVLTGRVVGWKVDAHVENSPTGRGPSYRVLTFDLPMTEGYPTILWVEPASIVTE